MILTPSPAYAPSGLRLGRIVNVLKFAVARQDPVRDDLLRLAETSPHLLADLGFAREDCPDADGPEVWTRPGSTIVVSRGPDGVRTMSGRL